ncbi:hypothetical protein KSS87_007194 [Heliosperma pusillum]|nr:hypothetical protein KSS87_007194 [Heliosperma pusillum]
MDNEERKTHCSQKEIQYKQHVMKKGGLIVHTRSYIANKWVMKKGRLIVHTRSYNANNG